LKLSYSRRKILLRIYKFLLVISLVACWSTTSASAATLNVSDGQLMGASGVDVNGALYDVEFIEGTCIALYSGCDEVSDFPFQTEDDARDAAQALLDQVFIDGVYGQFDTIPTLTYGCSYLTNCYAIYPVALHSDDRLFKYMRAGNWDAPDFDNVGVGNRYRIKNSSADAPIVYAVWSVIPEPGTGLLVGLGLVALCARGRRVH
jgi:hypothetical protein